MAGKMHIDPCLIHYALCNIQTAHTRILSISPLIFSKVLPFHIYSWTKTPAFPSDHLTAAAQLNQTSSKPFSSYCFAIPATLNDFERSAGQQTWKGVFNEKCILKQNR